MSRLKSFKFIALLLAVGLVQATAQLCFAQPAASLASAAFPQPQLLARLTTKGNQPITVNGASATSGDSVPNDATIETPANIDATVDLGPLGSVDIAAGTKIKLEFDGACTGGGGSLGPSLQCGVKVTVFSGCITSHYTVGSYHQAVNEQQSLIKDSDKSRKSAGSFNSCTGVPAGAAAAGDGGLSTVAIVALVGVAIAGGTIIILAATGNPSPATP